MNLEADLRECILCEHRCGVDRMSGERNQCDERLSELLVRLTGAEAGIAVNNNAAACVLILSTFAAGRETIVSRGELVEIGGSFRMPDVMERATHPRRAAILPAWRATIAASGARIGTYEKGPGDFPRGLLRF